ncbi:MAG: DUF4339 domain-containing protein [Planctomycetaceae bacterium]|jgi:hypothetical protein|nr:DUF4339 domain-containing protein [Planctomycetaceae bacterium]
MSSQWFTKRTNEAQRGPFSDRELKQFAHTGELLATDLVWREGIPQAVPASKIKGLFPESQSVTPPPVPPQLTSSSVSPPPLVDPNNLDALIAGLVPTQQVPTQHSVTGYVPNSAASRTVSRENEKRNQKEKEDDDIFSWYRPGDPRTPILVNSITFWQAIHAIGSKNNAFYFLLPIIVAIPFGFLLGIINTLIPFFIINWLISIIVCLGFGEAIFQCFRLAGIKIKLFSIGYGFLIGLLTCYFFLAGGLFCAYNLHKEKEEPPLSLVRTIMPSSIVWYVKTQADTMSIGKPGQILLGKSPPPNRFRNYLFIFVDLFIIVLVISAGAGGGRQNVPNGTAGNSGESTDDSTKSDDDKIAKMYGIN